MTDLLEFLNKCIDKAKEQERFVDCHYVEDFRKHEGYTACNNHWKKFFECQLRTILKRKR